MAVKLIQVLCPERHCIIAIAYDDTDKDDAAALLDFQGKFHFLVDSGAMNPWCALCGSKDLKFDVGTTGFANLAEAEPILLAHQAAQMQSQMAILAARERRN